MKLLGDYVGKPLKQFFNNREVAKEMCRSIGRHCAISGGGGGGLTSVSTQDTPSVTWIGDGQPGSPLQATVISQITSMTGTVSTTDATPTTIITIPATTPGAYSFQVRAVASNGSTEAAYINIAALVMNNAGTVNLVGAPAYIFTPIFTGSLGGADITIDISGTNILVWVTGETGQNLNWKVLVTLVAV